jgi:hypothetical protein
MIKASCLPIAPSAGAAESGRNPRAPVHPVPRESARWAPLLNRRALGV